MSIYLQLTEEFNLGVTRAIICSGQAVVLHRLAIMSKDGDWILRESEEALAHIRSVLESHGARYRFGAPLDARWMRGGWSAHFEFEHDGIRVRTDFFTRPPRLSAEDLARIWAEQQDRTPPFTNARDLALLKMTQREKDYPVIGELARLMSSTEDQLRFSRSARDICRLVRDHPEVAEILTAERPLLGLAGAGRDKVAEALDAERRRLIQADEERLGEYRDAYAAWEESWRRVQAQIRGLPLNRAHAIVVREAEALLPKKP